MFLDSEANSTRPQTSREKVAEETCLDPIIKM